MKTPVLESDKKIVYVMGTTLTKYTFMSPYEYETIHEFGERAGIINTLKYMSVINRLRRALDALYIDNRCTRFEYGRGYSYNFTKSLTNPME